MKGLIRLLGGVCVVAICTPALGQTPAAVQASGVQDIVVTAQRRSESLSKTPVAIEVVTSEQLAKANIVSEQDLREATPGLSVRAGLNSNNLNYSLRGQSQDPYASTRPGVLPYFNEVQIGGAGGVSAPSSAFYDLQSVQVLKGPQGTLFGRSATGGAVLFTSKKPGDKLEGYLSGLVGNYNAYKLEGAIGGPVDANGVLKIRVAGIYQQRDGYQHNIYNETTDGNYKRRGGRVTAILSPIDGLHNEFVFDYLKSDGTNIASVLSGIDPYTGAPPPYVPLTLLYGGSQSAQAIAAGAATVQAFTGVDAATARAQYLAFFTGREGQSVQQVLAAQNARGPYAVDDDGPNLYRVKSEILSNATTYELGSNSRIRNIFGLVIIDQLNGVDADGTPYTISQSTGPAYITQNSRQISDELQLQGKAFDNRLDYIVGGYYSHEQMLQDQTSHSFDILFGGAAQTYNFGMINTTYAGYSQVTYDLNGHGLGLTAGGRYTSEKVEKEVLPFDSSYDTPGIDRDESQTYKAFSWTVGLKDQITPRLLGYLVSRRSYKSGGFNGTLPAVGGADSFKSERVTDIELGAKFSGRLGTIPARADIALYHNWIDNDQRAAFALLGAGPAGLTVNVPEGTTNGVEMDGQVQPAPWLSLGGNFNYTHAAYSSQLTDLLGVGAPYDQVTDTPKFSGAAFADITVPVSTALSANLHSDVYAQSKSFTSPLSRNNYGSVMAGYSLVNLRAGLTDKERGISLFANVKNLLDKTYYVGGQATGEVYQLNLLVPGERRTFTVELRVAF